MINLLPQNEKIKRKQQNRSLMIVFMSIAVLMITSIVGIIFINLNTSYETEVRGKEDTILSLETKIKKASQVQLELSDSIDRINTTVSLANQRISWTKIISEFSKVVPVNVKVNSFSASDEPIKFTISAETLTRKDVENFKQRIEASTYFKNVIYNSTTEVTSGTTPKVTFSMTFQSETPDTNKAAK